MTNPNPGSPLWPVDFQGGTVTGQFLDSLGFPLAGKRITFTPTPVAMVDDAHNITILGVAVSVILDATGSFTKVLPATDDPDIQPQRWTYRVTEEFSPNRTYYIEVPQNSVTDLIDVAPLPRSDGQSLARGRRGPAGGVQWSASARAFMDVDGSPIVAPYADVSVSPGLVEAANPKFGRWPTGASVGPGQFDNDITVSFEAAVLAANGGGIYIRQRPIVLPAGNWVYHGKGMSLPQNSIRLYGPGSAACQLTLDADVCLFYSGEVMQQVDFKGFQVNGGFGLLWMPRQDVTGSNPLTNYRCSDVIVNNHTGTAVFHGGNGPPNWEWRMRINGAARTTEPPATGCSGTGGTIGIAVKGIMDMSTFKLEGARVSYLVKAGHGGHTSLWSTGHVHDAGPATITGVTLSAPLVKDAQIITLPVNALTQAITANAVVTVTNDAGVSQIFRVAQAAAVGDTVITVNQATVAAAFPVTSVISVNVGRLASLNKTWTNTDVWLIPSYTGSAGRAFSGGTFLASKQGSENYNPVIDDDYLVCDQIGTLAPASGLSGRGLSIELLGRRAIPYQDGSGWHLLPEVLGGWTVSSQNVAGGVQLVVKKNGVVVETSRTLTSPRDAAAWGSPDVNGFGVGDGTPNSATSKYIWVQDLSAANVDSTGGSLLASDLPAPVADVPFSTFGSALPNYKRSFGFFKEVTIISNTKTVVGATPTRGYIQCWVAPKDVVGVTVSNLRVVGVANGGAPRYVCEFLDTASAVPPTIFGLNSLIDTAVDSNFIQGGTNAVMQVSNVPGAFTIGSADWMHDGVGTTAAYDPGGTQGAPVANPVLTGTDRNGSVTWTTGAGATAAGAAVVVTFGLAYGATPVVEIIDTWAGPSPYRVSVSKTGFTVGFKAAPPNATAASFSYRVIPNPS